MELKLPPPKQRLKQENERASRELLKEENKREGREGREEKGEGHATDKGLGRCRQRLQEMVASSFSTVSFISRLVVIANLLPPLSNLRTLRGLLTLINHFLFTHLVTLNYNNFF